MSDAFLELLAKADPTKKRQAELLLDTNVMMEIYSIGDLLRDGDQLAERLGADAALTSAKFRYRILRARHSIMLAWWLAQSGTVAGVLGNEVVDMLEGVMAPKEDLASYALTTAIMHVTIPSSFARCTWVHSTM